MNRCFLDATKFVNDDYVLACSLENGQVLFLTNYQDQSPISVNTELQNIKMDWSSPGEILAVGGHKRSNDLTCINQIQFYSRYGEFLHRVQIPPTVRILLFESYISLNLLRFRLDTTIICSMLGSWQW